MRLSDRLRKDSEEIWRNIREHPFVRELFRGILPMPKFRRYVLQDYNYLVSSIKNFAILASRAPTVRVMRELVEITSQEARGEFEGYHALLSEMDLSIEEAQNQVPTQTSLSYSAFLLSTSTLASFEEGLAAVLPCYWSYAEMADYHKREISNNKNPIYKKWAGYYLEADYLQLVDRIKNLVEETGGGFPYDRMRQAFLASSRFELLFWDSVYQDDSREA